MNPWMSFAAGLWTLATLFEIAGGNYWLAFLTGLLALKDLQIARFMWENDNS